MGDHMYYFYNGFIYDSDFLVHYGRKGMKWGKNVFGYLKNAAQNNRLLNQNWFLGSPRGTNHGSFVRGRKSNLGVNILQNIALTEAATRNNNRVSELDKQLSVSRAQQSGARRTAQLKSENVSPSTGANLFYKIRNEQLEKERDFYIDASKEIRDIRDWINGISLTQRLSSLWRQTKVDSIAKAESFIKAKGKLQMQELRKKKQAPVRTTDLVN